MVLPSALFCFNLQNFSLKNFSHFSLKKALWKFFSYFLKRKLLLHFRKKNPAPLSPSSKNKKKSTSRTFLIFKKTEIPTRLLINFSKEGYSYIIYQETELSYISENGNPKNLPDSKSKNNPLLNVSYISGGNLQSLKMKYFHTFSYKEAKFSKLKYFLIITMKHFLSLYNLFFYTQQAFVFRCFFFFYFRNLSRALFVVFLYFLDNI